jgi:CheY-like chemotaxis protein
LAKGSAEGVNVYLDRCPDEVVVKICEAVKLYLDAPGLIFILACDQSVLARGVSSSARGGAGEGRSYLEKIVQISYRVPPPDEAGISRLIRGYARKSNTSEIIDDAVEKTLADRAERNPRKIKRIINSFILEYKLDPAWRDPMLGSGQLVTAILLQHLYAPFYDLLVRDESGRDTIGEFLDYVDVRDGSSEIAAMIDGNAVGLENDLLQDLAKQLFEVNNLHWPPNENFNDALKRLEQRLPEEFKEYAKTKSLISLLRATGNKRERQALRDQLLRHPLTTEASRQGTFAASSLAYEFDGTRIICIDDNPDSLLALINALEGRGASVEVYSNSVDAEREILRRPPEAVISDIARGDDPNAGFAGAERLRNAGYKGPIIFFTARITPERRTRARALGASGVVVTEEDVIAALKLA